MNGHRYILEPYKGPASRVRCPQCAKPREFARYLDQETRELLPDHVGRCNREESCGYHMTPAQHFEAIRPIGGGTANYHPPMRQGLPKQTPPAPQVDTLSLDLVEKTMTGHDRNNLVLFLRSLFGASLTNELIARFFIGTSRHWDGSTVFWQIDGREQVRQAKVMLYDPATGRRVKSETIARKWDNKAKTFSDDHGNGDKIFFAGKALLSNYDANLVQCFFGEHQVPERPGDMVGIVESEKTAVIASVYFPRLIWLATGGKNGARWIEPSVLRALQGRDIILFPDLNAFEKWSQKAQEIKKAISCKVMVSDLLETIATDDQRASGLDLADFLLVRDEAAGWAVTDHGYPVMMDA